MPDYALGALPRAHDPTELRYRLVREVAIDVNKPRSLGAYRSPVENQGGIGSCTAHGVTSAAEMLAAIQGRPVVQLNRGDLYWRTRSRANWYGQGQGADTGASVGDACDAILGGEARQDLWPYIADAKLMPPASLAADAPNQDYALAHQPLYGSDPGGFVAGICQAIDELKPPVIGMAWYDGFFSPPGGVLPASNFGQQAGGHCIHIWGRTRGLVWCRNSWAREWTAPVAEAMRRLNPEAEAGDFAIPDALLSIPGLVYEIRALSPEPVAPPPPEPAPTTKRLYFQVWDPAPAGAADPWIVTNYEHPVPTGGDYVIVKAQKGPPGNTEFLEDIVVPFTKVEGA